MLDSDHVERVISEVLRNSEAPSTSSSDVDQKIKVKELQATVKVVKEKILENRKIKQTIKYSDDDMNKLRPSKVPLTVSEKESSNDDRPWTISEMGIAGVSSLLLTLLILLTAVLLYKVSLFVQFLASDEET